MTPEEQATALDAVDPVELGARIKAARKASHLSQRRMIGDIVTAAYISRIENGERRPSLAVLTTIAQRCQTSIDYLLTGKQDHDIVAELMRRQAFMETEIIELRRRLDWLEQRR